MRPIALFSFVFLGLTINVLTQTLVASYPLPRYTYYDYVWGITVKDGYLYLATDYTPNTSAFARIYKATKSGSIVDSIISPIHSNHGIAWDGSHFWIAEGYRATGCRIYKATAAGAMVDSFQTPPTAGSPTIGIGDLAIDGNKLWYTVFSPDFVSYPNGYAFAIDIASKSVIDTIPLRGRQVLGIASKGDTIFYVNENQYSGEVERIYAYSHSVGDTIFSFPVPDPDGQCNPKALHWDGTHLWLVAERIGGSSFVYKTLYKYEISGGGNPVITSSTNMLNFGNVKIGADSVLSLTISNIGSENLIISQMNFSNPEFSLLLPFNIDTITPGSQNSYNIKFAPSNYGQDSALLSIISNDAGTPNKTIRLYGKGIYDGPHLQLEQNVFNFGSRRVHSTNGWYLNISNQGSSPLIIYSINSSTTAFFADSLVRSFPVIIDSQNTVAFKIWFRPGSVGLFQDSLEIETNLQPIIPFKVHLTGTGVSGSAGLGNVLWEATVPDNPYAYIQDYKPMSMKPFQDVNGDGVQDIIVASRNYLVLCYNGNASGTGDYIWQFNTGYNNNNTGAVMFEDALQVRSDIDGDGIQDVVFGCGGGNEFVYTISGKTGRTIWAYGDSITYDDGDINGLRADKDFNADGIADVLVSASGSGTGGRHSVICLNGINGSVLFTSIQQASFTFDITSMPNGGAICVDLSNGGPYKLNRFNDLGQELWSIGVPDVIWSLRQIPDINNDGQADIAAFTGGINVNMLGISGFNGAVFWQTHYPLYATFSTIHQISDLNNNQFADLIFSGKEGVFRLDSQNGATIWSNALDASYVFGVYELDDFTNDGIKEIGAGTKNSNLFVLNGANGNVIQQYNYGSPVENSVERVIKLQDIDANGYDEIVAGVKNGIISCYSGGSANPIPVEITSFTATVNNDKVQLNWQTATELNNQRFEVQRADEENGIFNTVGIVKGAGTTSEHHYYTYTDAPDFSTGKKFYYRLKSVSVSGEVEFSEILTLSGTNEIFSFELEQNYPNPFNPLSRIDFSIPADTFVKLELYDQTGQLVMTLVNGNLQAGKHAVIIDAENLVSGVYFYRLLADGKVIVKKLTILK